MSINERETHQENDNAGGLTVSLKILDPPFNSTTVHSQTVHTLGAVVRGLRGNSTLPQAPLQQAYLSRPYACPGYQHDPRAHSVGLKENVVTTATTGPSSPSHGLFDCDSTGLDYSVAPTDFVV